MKFAVGSLYLECNSFSPERSDLNYFRNNGYLLFGDEIFEYHKNLKNELAGFIDVSNTRRHHLVPTCAGWAVPHGPLTLPAYTRIKEEFLQRIVRHKDIDGVYLALHGSMLVEGIDDPEGDLLADVREMIGKKALVVSLDFHANVTTKIVRNTDILIGYNSFPHNNLYEVGQKAATLIYEHVHQLEDIRRIFIKIPLIAPMENMTIVDDEPMAKIMKELQGFEKKEGVLALSFFGVQSWLDIDQMGSSVVGVVFNEQCHEAQQDILRIATDFWDKRDLFFDFLLFSPQEAIRKALAMQDTPIILNESSDNVGAGATGDSTFVLRALLEMHVTQPTLLTIVDPEAVQQAIRAGVGNSVELAVGGKINTEFDHPLQVRGKVRTIFDGKYRYMGPVNYGSETSMGKTVVLEINQAIFLELTELPVYTIDPEHYRCVGLFPERAKLVVIKSQGSFRASYDHISRNVLYLDTPGLSSSNIENLPFRTINKKEFYPFNKEIDFVPTPLIF